MFTRSSLMRRMKSNSLGWDEFDITIRRNVDRCAGKVDEYSLVLLANVLPLLLPVKVDMQPLRPRTITSISINSSFTQNLAQEGGLRLGLLSLSLHQNILNFLQRSLLARG